MESTGNNKSEVLACVQQGYDKLTHLWSLYGFNHDTIEKRKKNVLKYTQELYGDMVCEEERRLDEKRGEVRELSQSISSLVSDLELGSNPANSLRSSTILAQIEELGGIQSSLRQQKEERMKEWNRLKRIQKGLLENIGESYKFNDPFNNNIESNNTAPTSSSGIPGKEQHVCLESEILGLKGELSRRVSEYVSLRSSVKSHFTELEKLPVNTFERNLVEDVNDEIVYTTELLQTCKELESGLRIEIIKNETEGERLRASINDLLRRLSSNTDTATNSEGNEQLNTGPNCLQEIKNIISSKSNKPSAIHKLRTVETWLLELKRSNMSRFISELKREIQELCSNIYLSIQLPESDDDSTECKLDEYEKILENCKEYSIRHKKLLEYWKKREGVWEQWILLENQSNDPNRFNNRGGALLKYEKIKKGLEKSLPKLEKEILGLAALSIEESAGSGNGGIFTEFRIFGQRVSDIIQSQWDTLNKDKEDKKKANKIQSVGGVNGTSVGLLNQTRKRPMTPGGVSTPALLATPSATNTPGKRGKLTTFNSKFIPSGSGGGVTPTKRYRPGGTGTTTRAATTGLRPAPSRDNILLVSPTYSEFTSHKQIFQSTMMGDPPPTAAAATGGAQPSNSNNAATSNPTPSSTTGLKFVPRELPFNKF